MMWVSVDAIYTPPMMVCCHSTQQLMDIVDIIEGCLSLVPAPHLRNDFLALSVIWASVGKAETSRQQLRILAYSIAQFLQTLDTEYRASRLIPAATSLPLVDLRRSVCMADVNILLINHRNRLLDEISTHVHTQSTYNFLKLLHTNAHMRTHIDGYSQRLHALINSFQVC